MIAWLAAAGVAITLAMTLVRLFAGPTLYDRALAATGAIGKTAVVCAALAVLTGQPRVVEVACVLLLGSFALHAATLKFFRVRTFQAPMAQAEDR